MVLICITRSLLTGPARPILAPLSHPTKYGAAAIFVNLLDMRRLCGTAELSLS